MFKANDNYLKLPGSYLFSTVARKQREYVAAHPDCNIIRLSIGDVTQPLAPAIIDALHKAVDEMAVAETFRGYAPDLGYDFLRSAIVENDYKARGVDIATDEVFVSDGAKSDSANIQEIFAADSKIAVCDPVYPVYVDSNVMAGRTGTYDSTTGLWSDVIYMPCSAANKFAPELPKETPDIIYLCFPNNPTGATVKKEKLQEFVDYANKVGAVIIYDAAYEAFITDPAVPHSIYEVEGAKECAIEMCSLSKTAGFTGMRCGYTIIPTALHVTASDGTDVSIAQIWGRRQGSKFNGVSYPVQCAAAAVFTEEGLKQIHENIAYYQENAAIIAKTMEELGIQYTGGKNSPYIWLKCPNGMSSWEFFDYLLHEIAVVGTPGEGFGKNGEGWFRLTAFGDREKTKEAMQRMKKLLSK